MGVAPPYLDDTGAEGIGPAALRVMLAIVAREPDPAERKARIMILRGDGLLTDRQASDLIQIYGLEAA